MAILYPNKYDASATIRDTGYITNAYLGAQFTNNTGTEIKITSVEIYCKNEVGSYSQTYKGWIGETLNVGELTRSNKQSITTSFGWQKFTFISPLIIDNGKNFYAGIANSGKITTYIRRYTGSTVGNAYYLATTSETSGVIQSHNTVMSSGNLTCTPHIRINYEITTTKCEPPKNLKITPTKIQNKEGGSLATLTWEAGVGGNNNKIVGYEIAEQSNSGSYVSLYVTAKTSLDISYNNSPVGNVYRYKVRTVGSAGENYHSDYTEPVSCTIINSKPVISSLKADNTKIPTNGATVKFSWEGTDVDGDALTYSYKLVNENGTTISSNTTTSKSVSIAVGVKGNKTFYVKAYDKTAYSDEVSIQLQYNNKPGKPIIKTASGGYTNKASFSWSCSDADNQSLTYAIERRIGDNGNWVALGTTTNTNYTDNNFPAISYAGLTIYYRIKANDGIEYGEYSEFYSCVRNIPPSTPTNFASIPYGITVSGKNTIAENQIKLSWNQSSGSQSSRFYYIEKQISSNGDFSNSAWSTVAEKVSGSEYIHTITDLSRGTYIKYRIRCIDSLGESSEYNIITQVIKRNVAPLAKALTSNSFSNKATINIWETSSTSLIWDRMESDDDDGTYALVFKYGSKIFDVFLNKTIADYQEPYFVKFSESSIHSYNINFIEEETLSNFIKLTFGMEANGIFLDGYFELYTKDNFGITGSTSKIYVNFNTKYTPILTLNSNNDYLKISGLSDNYVRTFTTDNYYAMVNSGETIKFEIPAPEDKNLNETFKYRIKVCESTTNNKINNPVFTKTIYESKEFEKPKDNFLEPYSYVVPNIETNIVVRYSLEIIDSTGEMVSVVYPHGVELCRYAEPLIELKSIVAQSNNSLKGIYKVIDNGGSSFDINRKNSNGSIITYNDRRNLERCNGEKLYKIEVIPAEGENIEILLNTNNYPYLSDEIEFITAENTYNLISVSRNAYLKITIKNVKNNNETDTSIIKEVNSNVLMVYKIGAAALSGRMQGIGINVEPEARFQVAPQESNEVAIFGEIPSGTSNNFPIIINLTTGRFVAAILDFGDYDE